MELLLNALWVLVSLATLAMCLRRQEEADPEHGFVFSVIALGCVFLLLFPVISMTDDLNAAALEMEDANLLKRFAGWQEAHRVPVQVPELAALLLLGALLLLAGLRRSAESHREKSPPQRAGYRREIGGRAPPTPAAC